MTTRRMLIFLLVCVGLVFVYRLPPSEKIPISEIECNPTHFLIHWDSAVFDHDYQVQCINTSVCQCLVDGMLVKEFSPSFFFAMQLTNFSCAPNVPCGTCEYMGQQGIASITTEKTYICTLQRIHNEPLRISHCDSLHRNETDEGMITIANRWCQWDIRKK